MSTTNDEQAKYGEQPSTFKPEITGYTKDMDNRNEWDILNAAQGPSIAVTAQQPKEWGTSNVYPERLPDAILQQPNERKPMLSSAEMRQMYRGGDYQIWITGACDVREYYENLITSGKLRVVEEVEFGSHVGSRCSGCGFTDSEYHGVDFTYCPGCGNKIKR